MNGGATLKNLFVCLIMFAIALPAMAVEAPDPLPIVEILDPNLSVEVLPEIFKILGTSSVPFDSLGGFYYTERIFRDLQHGLCKLSTNSGTNIIRVDFNGTEIPLVRFDLFQIIPNVDTFTFEFGGIFLRSFDSFNGFMYVQVSTVARKQNQDCKLIPGELDFKDIVLRISGFPNLRDGFPSPFPGKGPR